MSMTVSSETANEKPIRLPSLVEDNGPLAYLMDTARFEHLQRISRIMGAAAFLPQHLKGKTPEETAANCFRVVNQALRWNMDPFAVCDETYCVSGKLGYQGKLVAAVINSRAGLAAPLGVIYSDGKAQDLAAVVYGSVVKIPTEAFDLLKDYAETESSDTLIDLAKVGVLVIRLTIKQAATQNKLWTTDPQQKLYYSAVVKWARRHRPEIMLGVLTDDDIEKIKEDISPPEQSKPQLPTGRHSVRANGHANENHEQITREPILEQPNSEVPKPQARQRPQINP